MSDIAVRRIGTARIGMQVRERAAAEGSPETPPVLFVHGNVSSSVFWTSTMRALPPHVRALAVDLRGFGGTDPAPVDATRGLADFADDVRALLDALDIPRAHLVGWSMGGGVVLQNLLDAPDRVASLTLVNPVPPFGFGGTRGVGGDLCAADGSPSGAAGANPEFVARLAAGDGGDGGDTGYTGDEPPMSPRNVLLAYYVKPGFVPDDLDELVAGMLSTVTGDDNYPGNSIPSAGWPGTAPGARGVLNAMSPLVFRIPDLSAVAPKPPILWLRGAEDVIVSDTSFFDLAYLGSLGAVPGWPGEETHPAQPMLAQTRAVLGTYAAAGGAVTEVVIADAGHSPQLEKPAEFGAALRAHIGAV